MKEGGKKLRKVVDELLPFVKEGVTTEWIDKKAEVLIMDAGGEPSFKRVRDYRWSMCLPVNEQIVHTPPSKRTLRKGDILTLDVGIFYQGFHTDFATTLPIGSVDQSVEKFLQAGERALEKAIKNVKLEGYIGEISKTIEDEVKGNGYYILKELTGHGVGQELHEDPFVPGFLKGKASSTPRIKPGLTLAIEVIYSMGTEEIAYEGDWSIITKDRSLSACFEKTIALNDLGTMVLT